MTTLETLNRWLADAPENEHLEFKEAKQQYDTTKLLRYCVALANEGGGHLVLGVSDKRPRQVVGTQAFQNRGEITARILEALRMRVEVQELQHPNGRVLVFAVPPRPAGTPLHHEGAYLMRAGEELVPMSPDHLKRIFAEGGPDWFDRPDAPIARQPWAAGPARHDRPCRSCPAPAFCPCRRAVPAPRRPAHCRLRVPG